MQNFKTRKLFLLCLLFVSVFCAYMLVPFLRENYFFLFASAVTAVCILLGRISAKKLRDVIFVILALLTALSSSLYASKIYKENTHAEAYADGNVYAVEATVTEVSYTTAYSSSYTVRIDRIGEKSEKFLAVLDIESGTSFAYGDMISCEAAFEPLGDEDTYLRGKDILVRICVEDAAKFSEAKRNIKYYLHEANNFLCKRMNASLGRELGGFCSALIFGNKKYVDAGIRLDFSRVGISHLLALSGLHLSIFAQTLNFILRGFTGKKLRNTVIIVSCFFFAAFTGMSVSILRAAMMLAFVFGAEMIGEENDPLSALFAAASFIIILNGNTIYDVSFLLSFVSTLGIILLNPAINGLFAYVKKPKKNKALRILHTVCKYFYGIFTMTLAASFFTLPITAFTFGEISLIGILSNFIFIPLATTLLISCIFFVPLSFIPYLSSAASFVCGTLAKLIISLAHGVSDIKGIVLSLKYPFSAWLFAILAVFLFLCVFVKKLSLVKFASLFTAFAIAFSVCFAVYSNMTENETRIRVESDNSREFIAVDTSKENYVIDVSTGGYSFMYGAVMSVKELSCTEVDNLVLTHYHIYHPGAINRLSDVIKIRNVLLPIPETEAETEIFTETAAALMRLGIPYGLYRRGEAYTGENASIDFAPAVKISRSVKPIVIFSIICGDSKFSYIESAAFESDFDLSPYISADTVFIGGHGPSRKKVTPYSALEKAESIIFAEEAFEYFDVPYDDGRYTVTSDGGINISLEYVKT